MSTVERNINSIVNVITNGSRVAVTTTEIIASTVGIISCATINRASLNGMCGMFTT